MADISKITLPNGTTYNIKDAVARASMGAGGMTIVWGKSNLAGTSAPSTDAKASIPDAALAYYNGGSASASGTLVAASADKNKFYLVAGVTTDPSGSTKGGDFYDEWVAIQDGSSWVWEKVGDTQFTGDLATTKASFVKTLASGTHQHTYASVSGITISSGGTGDVTVATGGITTAGSASLSSSSSTSTGAITYLESVSAAAQGHTHSATVGTTRLNVSRTTDAVVGSSTTWIGVSVSGGGYASPSKSYFLTSAEAGGTGTVSASNASVVGSLSPTSKKLTTTSIRPAKSITTTDFVTSATTTKFGQVAAYTGLTGSVTAVTSRGSATSVATGALSASGTGAAVVTNVTAPNTVQSVSSQNVVTDVTLQSSVVTTATYIASTETLQISAATQSANATSINVPGSPTTTQLTVTTSKLEKTDVYSANAPTSTSVSFTPTTTNVIGATAVATGASVNVITAVTKAEKTIDPRDTAVTVATGGTSETSVTSNVGDEVVTAVSSTAKTVVGALTGTTTFLTSVSAGSAQAITALGTQSSFSASLSNGASGSGKAQAIIGASISTQPVITLSTVDSGGVAVGTPGTISIASTGTAAVTGTTKYLKVTHTDPTLSTTKLSGSATSTSVNTGNNNSTVITGIESEGDAITGVTLQ